MADENILELKQETNIRKEEKYHAVYWIPKSKVSEYMNFKRKDSTMAKIVGMILARDAWYMSEEEAVERGIEAEVEEIQEKDIWLVSVNLDGESPRVR